MLEEIRLTYNNQRRNSPHVTTRMMKRANMIIETVGSIKVIDDAFKLQKMIVQVGGSGRKYCISGWIDHFHSYLNGSFYSKRKMQWYNLIYCVYIIMCLILKKKMKFDVNMLCLML